jgi:DNA-directed RNA polymerase specialized sigma24 family protein
MTGSEPMAEHLSEHTFLRAFSINDQPAEEIIDRALLRELELKAGVVLGPLQLKSGTVKQVESIVRNTRREALERAILELPYTERMVFCMHDGDGYDHARIASTLGISELESQHGLHQARLRIRHIVAAERARELADLAQERAA